MQQIPDSSQAHSVTNRGGLSSSSQVDPTASRGGASSLPASSMSKEREKQETPSLDKSEYAFWDRVRIRIAGYWASFILTGVMMPIVSSTILVALYFSFPDLVKHLPLISLDPDSVWQIVLFAQVITIMLWLIAAWVCYPFAKASSASSGSYGLLKASLYQLRAKLGIGGSDHDQRMMEERNRDLKDAIDQISQVNNNFKDTYDNCNQEALKTAIASYIDIREMLYHSPTGSLWALGSGYCNAWRLIHQAEEAIIEFDSTEEVIYGALKDKIALEGSTISSKDELLSSLIQAVTVLQPAAGIYFNEVRPDKNSGALAISSRPAIPFKSAISSNDEVTARSVLRSVRRVLNILQDRSWEGLLRARNRLLASIAITGLVTYILLCITVLTIPIPNASNHYTDPLVAATAFYIVGAVSGLFGRFYQESMTGSSVDDFGFSTTRLIAAPLLSGLAGIGGVLLLSTLVALGGSVLSSASGSQDLGQIFVIKPQLLLIAAIFGLAPNLLITGLQNTARQYESNIESSRVVSNTRDNR